MQSTIAAAFFVIGSMVAAPAWAWDFPGHRIVGAGGEIKLRGESAFEQRFRLEAEGVTFRGRRVNMRLHEFKFQKRQTKNSRVRRDTTSKNQ